jgi:hypothetical protein
MLVECSIRHGGRSGSLRSRRCVVSHPSWAISSTAHRGMTKARLPRAARARRRASSAPAPDRRRRLRSPRRYDGATTWLTATPRSACSSAKWLRLARTSASFCLWYGRRDWPSPGTRRGQDQARGAARARAAPRRRSAGRRRRRATSARAAMGPLVASARAPFESATSPIAPSALRVAAPRARRRDEVRRGATRRGHRPF